MAIAQQDFSLLSDQQLQQAMRFAQRSNNTPEFLGLMAEAQKRAKMRSEAQGMQAGQEAAQQPATLADQVMSGIANLDPGDQTYASGGIVAFAGGGTAASAAFGEFLRSQGVQPSEFGRLPKVAQDTLRQLYSNATLGPQAVGAVPGTAPAAAATPAAPAGGGYAAQPATLGQRAVSGVGAAIREMPRVPGGALLAGGSALTLGSANALSNATDEQLEQLSGDVGSDAGIAAAIMREARNTPVAAAKTPPAPRVEAQDRPYINPRTFQYPDKTVAAPTPRTERTSVVSTERVSGPGRSPSSVPEQAAAAVQSGVMSRDEYRKAMEAYAEGDNKELQGIFAKSMERDAKRRAELEGENASTKGILGIDISGDTRKAIQDAGIAMLRSKKPYLDIGEGIAAGLEGYDKRKEDRRGKLELLDKAEETRNLAILAAKQGNRKAAGEFMEKYDAYVDKIKDNERADKQLTQTGRYQDRMAGVAELGARNTAAYQQGILARHDNATKTETEERRQYAAILKQAQEAVDKDPMSQLKTPAEKERLVQSRLRSMLSMTPWLSKYAGGIGFSSAPAGGNVVAELTD